MRQVPLAGVAKPVPWRPVIAQRPAIGQDRAAVAAMGVIPMLVGAGLGAGMAWVGFSTGSRERGLLSILGYVFGAFGTLSAAGGVLGAILWVAGVSLIPEEQTPAPTPTAPLPPAPETLPASEPDFFREFSEFTDFSN
jgi:hypothetical protein